MPEKMIMLYMEDDGKPMDLPSGEHTKSNGKWPFIVSFPINSMVIFHGKMLVHQRVSDFDDLKGENDDRA